MKPPFTRPPKVGQELGSILIIIGGAIEVLGSLGSWNTYRVGRYLFRGKSSFPPTGSHLGVCILGILLIIQGVSLLRHWEHATRLPRIGRARSVSTIAFSVGILALYASGIEQQATQWVLAHGVAALRNVYPRPPSLAGIQAELKQAIAAGDTRFALAAGWGWALAGAIVAALGLALLFTGPRRAAAPD